MTVKNYVAYVDSDLQDLIPGFIENRQQDISQIESLLAEENFDQIRLLGHSMKGFGVGYGFNDISDIGAAIEVAAKDRDSVKIELEKDRLISYMNTVEIQYI